jgi:large subunit ribosomal protein L16
VFTGIQITKKPLSSRMGKGKGSISHWVSIIKKGQIIFEISGISDIMANIIFNRCRKQLPLKLKLIKLFF